MPEQPTTDFFHSALAFARAATKEDWEGAEALYQTMESPLDLLVPMSWLLYSLVAKMSADTGASIEDVWISLVTSIDTVQDEYPEE